MTNAPALALRRITKNFAEVHALREVSLIVERGSVHGLVGQNGAGKSTLIKVLAGIHDPDTGTIEINGVRQQHLTPHKVKQLGIEIIHQDRLLPPTLTVAQALFLGQEPRRHGLPLINHTALYDQARQALKRTFDLELPVKALIKQLSTAEQQIVQITRALLNHPTILVFDEPTTALVRRESELLFNAIERLREQGLTILYISHYLNEIERLCDRVTVLRNGREVATVDPKTTSTPEIVSLMIDSNVDSLFPKRHILPGTTILETQQLTSTGRLCNVSLTLKRGEVLGVTGLIGSGSKALAATLFGLLPASSGRILVDNQLLPSGSPATAVARQIGLVPEDRRQHGISLALSVRENATLASLKKFTSLGFLRPSREKIVVTDFIKRLAIHPPYSETPLCNLSGGNQQKVVLTKWLIHGANVILLDEPTVGIDIGAKVDIYREISTLAEQGAGILVFSSDLLELIGLTDRILVFFRGQVVANVASKQINQEQLLTLVTTGQVTGEDYVSQT
jgi:ribose transport system ATP-binding protein